MSYYPALKQRLTCREVAPHYGLKVNASGMALCPFHDEHSPSLKLSRGFHCFGCARRETLLHLCPGSLEFHRGKRHKSCPRILGFLRAITPEALRLPGQKWKYGFPMRRKFFTATTIY